MTLVQPPPRATAAFWASLAGFGDAPALVQGERAVSYADLAGRVSALAERLGTTRRLVGLAMRNDVGSVVAYLACLAGGHPVALVDAEHPTATAGLLASYDPDVVFRDGALVERREGTRHDLHPDLALLLSTSGSTGSPKLVRLSHTNLASNAAAIAAYLGIRADDVAATTLPLHYCYGLSVLNSHLAVGAAVALTDLSVVSPDFWALVSRHRVTTFPGVPHTFALLDAVGFADMEVPSLRYLTCAGGRLDPAAVARYAELGQRRGFDLVVMYGATEATARMAYLPADLALSAPSALGVPVPGGSLTLAPPPAPPPSPPPSALSRHFCSVEPSLPQGSAVTPGDSVAVGEVGELVYRGDNVMLGYATSPADLARGRDLTELRTGDLARRRPDGLLEIVGRVGRFAKVFGLRVDLDRVERALLAAGVVGYAADGGDRVVVAVDRSAAPVGSARVAGVLADELGLPAPAVVLVELDEVPRLASGKVDYATLARSSDGSTLPDRRLNPAEVTAQPRGGDVAEVFRQVLGRADVGEGDSFVGLGGDSLSYVAASLQLERVLGRLPRQWHTMTVAELASYGESPRRRRTALQNRRLNPAEVTARPRGSDGSRRRWGVAVETNVMLRAAAIVAIVGSHSNLFTVLGGAHLLLALAGWNFARFQLTGRPRAERVRGIARSTARIAVPSVLWLVVAAALSEKYGVLNVLLLNGVLGTREWSEAWHYWFVEALVWTLVALAALLAIPWIDRAERRSPFWFAMALVGVGLLTRYDLARLFGGDWIHRGHVVFWLFALGWAGVRARHTGHRLLVSAVTALTVPGFFPGDQAAREAVVVAGTLLLVWVPTLRVPGPVAKVAGVLASASLYVYLVHWQVYPAYEFSLPWLATALSLLAGTALWLLVRTATPPVERALARVGRSAARTVRPARGEIAEDGRRLSVRRWPTREQHWEGATG